jgi:hypothetical protein
MGKKRKFKGYDPAEAARKLADYQRYTRNTPSEWGVNRDALQLAQNAGVGVVEPTREKTARVERYNCFALLTQRRAITAPGPL